MAKSPRTRIALAQNFLRCPQFAYTLVQESSIGPLDIVYEIGPGRGILTRELAQNARQVFAIEKDPILARQLQKRFRHIHNVEVIGSDFLQHHISAREHKVFASIPYNVTAEIMRKIMDTTPAPSEACLIMQKEAAEKFAGSPQETQFSILAKPRFKLEIVRHLQRSDFDPVPGVDSVLLRIQQRDLPLIHQEERTLYQDFVRYGFGGWKKNLRLTFKPIFTYVQWKQLSRTLSFSLNVRPSELTVEQWLGLFDCFRERVAPDKQALISAENGGTK